MPTQTKKITIDTAALFFGKFIGLLLGMARLNYLTTYLGVSNFGVLNFATYFCSLFLVLFDFGISQLLIRELAGNISRSNEYVGKVILLKLFVVLFASLVVGAAALVSKFDYNTNLAILLTAAVFALNGVTVVLLGAFQAHRKMLLVSVANILNDFVLSVAIILLIGRYPFVATALWLGAGVALLNFAFLLVVYVRTVGKPQFRIDIPLWWTLLTESAPFAVSALGISMYTFIGGTVLKYTRGDTEVGLYSAGYKLISILTLIPTAFTQVVYPIFSDFFINSSAKLGKALKDSTRVMAQISIPLAVALVILAPKIFAILYPGAFRDAAVVLQVMIIGNAFVYLAWIIYSFLLAVNLQRYCMWTSLGVALLSVAMNLFVVPRFGYVGVALTSMTTDLILFGLYAFYAARIGYSISDGLKYLKILACAAMMGVFLFLARDWYFIPVVLGGIAVYGSMLFLLGVFGDQERELLAKLLKR